MFHPKRLSGFSQVFCGVVGEFPASISSNFQYSDGIYDIDYTAIPCGWTEKIKVVDKQHVSSEEAERLFTSFLRGGRRVSSKHKQQKVRNHGSY